MPREVVIGLSEIYSKYQNYCTEAEKRNERPVTFLSFIAQKY